MSGRHWRRARVEKPDLVVARHISANSVVKRGVIAVGHTVSAAAQAHTGYQPIGLVDSPSADRGREFEQPISSQRSKTYGRGTARHRHSSRQLLTPAAKAFVDTVLTRENCDEETKRNAAKSLT